MVKVYVVTKGAYSDYAIVTVCSNKEKAEQVIEVIGQNPNWQEYRIEEFELDCSTDKRTWYWSEIDRDGNEVKSGEYTQFDWEMYGALNSQVWKKSGPYKSNNKLLNLPEPPLSAARACSPIDHATALKAARDALYQYLASL